MGITTYSKFEIFKEDILLLPHPFHDNDILSDLFLLEKAVEKDIFIYYAPVEYLNENATVLIVGITPGFRQMKKAYSAVLCVNNHLMDNENILHQAKMMSSYEGPMRKNLIKMLNELDLPKYLSISCSSDLFSSANHLIHTTGLLPYPVFYKSKNFTGSTPNILKTKVLRKYVMSCFVNDVARLNNPLIIPLGVNVAKVLHHLSNVKLLPPAHILFGFPHPSGANGHRHKQFAENKQKMKLDITDYFQQF